MGCRNTSLLHTGWMIDFFKRIITFFFYLIHQKMLLCINFVTFKNFSDSIFSGWKKFAHYGVTWCFFFFQILMEKNIFQQSKHGILRVLKFSVTWTCNTKFGLYNFLHGFFFPLPCFNCFLRAWGFKKLIFSKNRRKKFLKFCRHWRPSYLT